MKRLTLVFLAACAIDDPELSTEESALTSIGSEIENAAVSGSVARVVDHTNASAGAYLAFQGGGYARYFFSTAYQNTQTRYVWARVIALSTAADSIAFQMDSGKAITWQLPVATRWTWVPLEVPFNLYEDQHSFRFTTVEPGVLIDRVLLTDSSFIPVAETYETESGSVAYPMLIGLQKIPYTRYVYKPQGSGSGGRVDIDVTLPFDASYTIWGRASIPDADARRMSIGRAGDAYFAFAWSPPITASGGWTWSKGPITRLAPADVLSIWHAGDGGKIDKILITNDDGFTLVESSPPPVSSL